MDGGWGMEPRESLRPPKAPLPHGRGRGWVLPHAALDEERAHGEGDDAPDPFQYLADDTAFLFQEFQHSFLFCFWLVIFRGWWRVDGGWRFVCRQCNLASSLPVSSNYNGKGTTIPRTVFPIWT